MSTSRKRLNDACGRYGFQNPLATRVFERSRQSCESPGSPLQSSGLQSKIRECVTVDGLGSFATHAGLEPPHRLPADHLGRRHRKIDREAVFSLLGARVHSDAIILATVALRPLAAPF